jgi:hypothetical protein
MDPFMKNVPGYLTFEELKMIQVLKDVYWHNRPTGSSTFGVQSARLHRSKAAASFQRDLSGPVRWLRWHMIRHRVHSRSNGSCPLHINHLIW